MVVDEVWGYDVFLEVMDSIWGLFGRVNGVIFGVYLEIFFDEFVVLE